MIVRQKTFTCKAFLLCMNFSFVIAMSQLDNIFLGKCFETIFSLCGIFFFVLHFMSTDKIQWETILKISALIFIGLVAMSFSGGATLLKLVLFFAVVQKVELNDVLDGYKWSLIIPFVFIVILSLMGIIELYYPGKKIAVEFGMKNPNTVPVIVFSIIVTFNLQKEDRYSSKMLIVETIISFLLYYFCRARTAAVVLLWYIVSLILFRNTKKISKVVVCLQYLFFFLACVSVAVAILFHSRTAIWNQINSLLSGRPWAWDLYLTQYGIKFFGQRINFTIAALDNAYLRLLIQYGFLTFFAYLFLFVQVSRFAYKNKKIVLLLSVIAYELYFMAEFGPILINFCPVLIYEAFLLMNQRQNGE